MLSRGRAQVEKLLSKNGSLGMGRIVKTRRLCLKVATFDTQCSLSIYSYNIIIILYSLGPAVMENQR